VRFRSRVTIALSLLIVITSFIQFSSFNSESPLFISPVSASTIGDATIYYVDVGQGDSIFMKVENTTILIDGGPRSAGSTITSFLNSINVTEIDIMIATHPDEDHIGGLVSVLESITVDMILYNGQNRTTQVFEDFYGLAAQSNLTLAERAQFYFLTTTSNFTVLNPVQPLEFGDTNLNSVVIKLQVGSVSFLFAGDAEYASEQSMLDAGLNLESDVLKVGHHGSDTSTSQAFLDAVNPSFAVISAGLNNQYGHPDNETIQRLLDKGVIIFGTYVSGTIVFETDGNIINVQDSPETIPELSLIGILMVMLSMLTIPVSLRKQKLSKPRLANTF
jgi:competence protein ComEC